MTKRHVFEFHFGDHEKDSDLKSLSAIEEFVWIKMLCFMNQNEGRLVSGGKPMPMSALAWSVKLTEGQTRKSVEKLVKLGICSRDRQGFIYSRRMLREIEQRKKSARFGKKGGNPALLKKPGTGTPNVPARSAKTRGLQAGGGKPAPPPPENGTPTPDGKMIWFEGKTFFRNQLTELRKELKAHAAELKAERDGGSSRRPMEEIRTDHAAAKHRLEECEIALGFRVRRSRASELYITTIVDKFPLGGQRSCGPLGENQPQRKEQKP